MTSIVKLDKIIDFNTGNVALDVNKIASYPSRYIRKCYADYTTTGSSHSTSWSLGATFGAQQDFKAGSLIRLYYYFPARNDSTSWGGIYVEPQVSFDNNTNWYSLGGSGYTAVMELGGQSIGFYNNTILIDPAQTEDFTFGVRLYHRSYDGTATTITNNAVNNVSGTADAINTVLADFNYYQHYTHIIVEELALLRGNE